MKRAIVVPSGEQELAQVNARFDAVLQPDAEAWAAACDDDVADYEALCCAQWRARAPADVDG